MAAVDANGLDQDLVINGQAKVSQQRSIDHAAPLPTVQETPSEQGPANGHAPEELNLDGPPPVGLEKRLTDPQSPRPGTGTKNVAFSGQDEEYESTQTQSQDRPSRLDATRSWRSNRFVERVKQLGIPTGPPMASPDGSPRRRTFALNTDSDEQALSAKVASGSRTEPSTPQRGYFGDDVGRRGSADRFAPIRRSNTDENAEPHDQGVSEDEGRTRLNPRAADWRSRSTAWMQTVRSNQNKTDAPETPETQQRPRHLRMITAISRTGANSTSNADASPSTWRLRSEPAAQKWRQLKAGLKLLGQKRREVNRQDATKSAELVAELLAGTPAALIFASHFLNDERDHKRIPVLLEQLKINITDSQTRDDGGSNRNINFRIELEYGSGVMKMKWVIHRSLRDFWNLHVRYSTDQALSKFHRHSRDTKEKIPRFPRSAFPFAGELRNFADEDEEEDDAEELENATPHERPARHRRQVSSLNFRRRSSAGELLGSEIQETDSPHPQVQKRTDKLADRQRHKLQWYLLRMVKHVMFRPGSNRMCRFLELSALGIKLAVEGGYHGKEGTLTIRSGTGVDFRRAWQPANFIERHKPMWFLIRHSYIVCVDNPASMNIYDVFLVDNSFQVTPKRPRIRDQKNAKDIAHAATNAARHPQHHRLRVANAERKLRLIAKNERQMLQFEESMRFMAANTIWSQKHRFDSFAPVRQKVFAQWLVDGRDYMWNVSRALNMARDVIYIHDWWLSPELYMRRPGAISHKWRLDRILKRKAEEGVKIFVIVYRNINSAIPIDSEYTKFALLDLHPNIFVQRSPNQYRQLEFFWAHHEKICIIDHSIVFCGGVDLCFGRWDTPEHRVVDDRPTGWEKLDVELNADTCQMWPGKDYSNPRVQDFHDLSQPFGEMYDRAKVPRMPWHDIGMQIVGQPARDMTRHYVQRWNFLLRQRKPTRPTPFLLPPPDFSPGDLEALGLEGTCNIQILRSACEWSLGTPGKTEHSIMNAYCKLIEGSDHFVYIENQFFISSCMVEGTKISNAIGDALYERIVRASQHNEDWAAVIVIPLMPGFESTVDDPNGTSIRLIMECQYRSICRGEHSLFGRLKAQGIEPNDYIRFFSLRAWGKIGPTKAFVTEQLYIHAKCMIVDDRHAIIGSANINERSLLGDRDSEVAACVFDADMIDSVMAGRPYKVGRFPHTLRMRLMREHLGIDVDHVLDEDISDDMEAGDESDSDSVRPSFAESLADLHKPEVGPHDLTSFVPDVHTFNHDADWEQRNSPFLKNRKGRTQDSRVTGTEAHKQSVDGHGQEKIEARDTIIDDGVEILVANPRNKGMTGKTDKPRQRPDRLAKDPSDERLSKSARAPPMPLPRMQTSDMGLTLRSQLPPLPVGDDTDIGGPPLENKPLGTNESTNPLAASLKRPWVTKDCMRDPVNKSFLRDTWHRVAENNTKLYRQVFRCMPDSTVTNWTQYHAASAHAESFAHSQGLDQSSMLLQQKAGGKTGPPGHGLQRPVLDLPKEKMKMKTLDKLKLAQGEGTPPPDTSAGSVAGSTLEGTEHSRSQQTVSPDASPPSDPTGATTGSSRTLNNRSKDELVLGPQDAEKSKVDFELPTITKESTRENQDEKSTLHETETTASFERKGSRKRRATVKSAMPPRVHDAVLPKHEADELMKLVQGNLVEFPYDWCVLG